MCLLICGISKEIPTLEELQNSCANNPDGFGFALVREASGGMELVSKRSMHSGVLIDEFAREVDSPNTIAWLFHSRIATSGAVNEFQSHPFRVGRDSRSVLAHNGILPLKGENGDSDTAHLARVVVPSMGGVPALHQSGVFDMFDSWVEDNNSKVAILSARSDVEYPLLIAGETLGKWRGDVWFSNDSYRYSYSWNTRETDSLTKPYTSRWAWASDAEYLPVSKMHGGALQLPPGANHDLVTACLFCDELIDVGGTVCPMCDACTNCGNWRGCHCWGHGMMLGGY
jgi:glutamine amidotransferase